MNHILKILSLLFLGISFTACSQKYNLKTQNENITANNIVEEVTKHVKHFPEEPIYLFTYTNASNFEVLVNDMLAHKYYGNESQSTAFDINPFLNTGTNKVTVKTIAFDHKDSLGNYGVFEFKTDSYDNLAPDNPAKNREGLFTYLGPRREGDFFLYPEKKSFEETVSFTLPDVPYKVVGWRDSEDLTKMDKDILIKNVVTAYQDIAKAYQNKDYDRIAQFSYSKFRDQAISMYFSKQQVQEGWEELIGIAKADDLKFMPLENYKLVFYGDGKLVGLRSTKKEKGFREASALLCTFKIEGHQSGAELDYLLHIPKGKTQFEVY